MTDTCCAPKSPPATADHCPDCGQRGRSVALLTVQAQVSISLAVLTASPYHFCATRGCPVVYFTATASPITRDQIRERVFQKETTSDVLVCYCFRYQVGVVQESDVTQRAAILADIIAGTQHGQCACTIRNPQGSCCLGNVRRLLREHEQHGQIETEEAL